MQLIINKEQINALCAKENISFLGLFGSQARGDTTASSDIDVLVDFESPKSYFQLAKIQDKFESIFHKKVDLVLRTAVKKQLKPYIMKDLITLYGEE